MLCNKLTQILIAFQKIKNKEVILTVDMLVALLEKQIVIEILSFSFLMIFQGFLETLVTFLIFIHKEN